jgi:hypothetical protein
MGHSPLYPLGARVNQSDSANAARCARNKSMLASRSNLLQHAVDICHPGLALICGTLHGFRMRRLVDSRSGKDSMRISLTVALA